MSSLPVGTPAVEPAVIVSGLTQRYQSTNALNGLSLSIDRGAIYGFVGPNGAGKTTTIRVLATLLRPTAGTATIHGCDVVAHPDRVRPLIGYMPDSFGVYEDLTSREYLEFYAATYKVPARARRQTANDLLELVDLQHRADDYVETLSRGMKQRLGVARCLVHNPEVLLLDEPASGMDPRTRVEFRDIMRSLQRMGKTIVVSSHILLELAELCTHVGIVVDGRVVRQGTMASVLRGMSGERTVRVVCLDADAARMAQTVLADQPDVVGVREEGTVALDADIVGDDAQLGAILRALITAGVAVVSFAPSGNKLEDVFMQLTSDVPTSAPADAGKG